MCNYLKYYLVVDDTYLSQKYLKIIKQLLTSGITCCQFRCKNISWADKVYFGRIIQRYCQQNHVVFIVNDDLQLAKYLNADGIHVGQQDSGVALCRKVLGPDKIIGLTVNTGDQIKLAQLLAPDYLGVGAIYKTASKQDAELFIDFKDLSSNQIPFVFIGGLNNTNLEQLWQYQPNGLAFISFLMRGVHNLELLKAIY